MITLSGVTKRYGIFAFLGINGAGKTTTIRMMAGILRPSSGTITIGGFDLVESPIEAKSIIGYIPDRPNLYPKLTGREFLYFVCDLYRMRSRDAERRIDEILDEYSLSEWQDELIEGCAAIVHNPQVLIVDEPMVGLDPHGAKHLKEALRRYANNGATVFLSTHSLHVAEELADHIAIIHRGSLLASGTLADIRALTGNRDEDLEHMFLELTASTPGH
jgi:ABC-2 type transport system ATP-binding protein